MKELREKIKEALIQYSGSLEDHLAARITDIAEEYGRSQHSIGYNRGKNEAQIRSKRGW